MRVLLVLGLLLRSVAGYAADGPADDAERLLDEGTRQFTEDADYEGARQSFEESYRIAPGWKALNGIALTYQEQGRYLDALETYERLRTEFGASLTDSQRATIDKRVHELEARIGVLAIDAQQTGVRVFVDGREIGQGPLSRKIRVTPGAHLVVATLAGHDAYSGTIEIGAKQAIPVQIDLAPEHVRVVVQHREAKFARRFARWIPWAVGAGGAALLLAGGTFDALAADDFATFDRRVAAQAGAMPSAVMLDDGLRSTATLERGIGVGLYVAGGAAIAAGIVLAIVNQPRYVGEAGATPTGPAAQAIVRPGLVLVGLDWRF